MLRKELAVAAINNLPENASWQEISECIQHVSTAEDQLESLLDNEHYLLSSLVESVSYRIYFKDAEGRYLRNNNAHLDRLGLSDPAEVKGKTDFDFFPKNDAERFRDDELWVMKSGRLLNKEERTDWPDGKVEWSVIDRMPLLDPGGNIIGTIGISRDITIRKWAVEHLKETLTELERSNAELQQFAYVASHDLQEPLRSMSGCMQLLEKRYLGKIDAKADEYINHAVAACQRMRNMIDGLLTLSRVNSSAGSLVPACTTDILNQVIANLSHQIWRSKASIKFESLPVVCGHPNMLIHLFQNLISNAIKFCGESPPEVLVRAEYEDNRWLFSISDRGIGIDSEFHEYIFKLFQRLHTHDKYKGTGLGLAICQRIVEQHGGEIWVESALGEGSTFFFTLPAETDRNLLLSGGSNSAVGMEYK